MDTFPIKQSCFRKWLASLSYEQLLEVAEDVSKALDYKADQMNTYVNRDKFSDFMNSEWGIKPPGESL